MLKKYRYDFEQDVDVSRKCKFAKPIYSTEIFYYYCFLQDADCKDETLCDGHIDSRPEWCPLSEVVD